MRLMNEREASAMLGVSLSWLQKTRCVGTRTSVAVPFVKLGCLIRYDRDMLEAWVKTQATTAQVPDADPIEPPRRRRGRPRKAEMIARREAAMAEDGCAQTLLTRIRNGDLTNRDGMLLDRFAPRQIALKGWPGLATPAEVSTAADVLCAMGWLSRYMVRFGSNGGRGSKRYAIHPAALMTGKATVPVSAYRAMALRIVSSTARAANDAEQADRYRTPDLFE